MEKWWFLQWKWWFNGTSIPILLMAMPVSYWQTSAHTAGRLPESSGQLADNVGGLWNHRSCAIWFMHYSQLLIQLSRALRVRSTIWRTKEGRVRPTGWDRTPVGPIFVSTRSLNLVESGRWHSVRLTSRPQHQHQIGSKKFAIFLTSMGWGQLCFLQKCHHTRNWQSIGGLRATKPTELQPQQWHSVYRQPVLTSMWDVMEIL